MSPTNFPNRTAPACLAALAACALLAGCARHQRPPRAPYGPPPSPPTDAPAKQDGIDPVDPEASNYQYPYPVSFFELNSQTQHLRMAYLDVHPQQPNGRTVLL